MSARKLGRFAGLVFVLAAFIGGVAVAGAEHGAPGAAATVESALQLADIHWD
jgi:hypothetical protein